MLEFILGFFIGFIFSGGLIYVDLRQKVRDGLKPSFDADDNLKWEK